MKLAYQKKLLYIEEKKTVLHKIILISLSWCWKVSNLAKGTPGRHQTNDTHYLNDQVVV